MRRLAKRYDEFLHWASSETIGPVDGGDVREEVAAPEVPMGHLYALGPLWIYVVDGGMPNWAGG
jgi:hypothetical protein